jgi:predicted site-specific integrase-resolvase
MNIKVTEPLSIQGLADRLGVPRQRVHNLVRSGKVKAVRMSSGFVIQPEEAARVLDAAVRINTREGRSRLVFDFI